MKIFFDVDGVLIDGFHTRPERRRRWDLEIERDLGIKFGHIEDFILRGSFMEVLHGRLDLEEELEDWLDRNNYDLKAWQVMNYWHEKDSKINWPLYDIVEKLVGRTDVSSYIATNQTHDRARYLWNELGFKNHFKDIYYSARLGCLKHDADYFKKIEEELGFDPRKEPVLFFDDDPKNIDVAAARGWDAALFDDVRDVAEHPAVRVLL